MIMGLLLLLIPIIVFFATLPASRKLNPRLRLLYRLVGGSIVFVGSISSLYLAAYTEDQGAIGALFFQIAVIVVYLLFSVFLLALHWFLYRRAEKKSHKK